MRTIEGAREHRVTVQRSRFLALLAPADDLEAVKAIVDARRRKLRKARHHCWACRLPQPGGGVIEQARDDGEVGRPGQVLLRALQHHDLQGLLLVSRIFGGVKLGAGGVSRAFRQAADGVIGLT